ncbi:MAG TPA: APC family permease [Fibrobacteria bacterium]|nr:APC family permease [Fibrobacteria bacterium]
MISHREQRQGSPRVELARVVGLPGAVLMGLGSILGTGIFVSIGIAAGIAGPSVVLALALAALVASFNGLSSAQLAASHPVSGGTYEYGYRYLNPTLGFLAGWLFLCAKSASAATAALGLAGYILSAFDIDSPILRVALATGAVLLFTAIVAGGMKRSNRANALIVSVTLVGLAAFILGGLPSVLERGGDHFVPFFLPGSGLGALLHATALMFVAYTGYGRIATLGEEVREPSRTIPQAMVLSLFVVLALYLGVAGVAIGAEGPAALSQATRAAAAPLEVVAERFGVAGLDKLVALAAITAMAGVLLNLLLGISRVMLAMARRRDLPGGLGKIDGHGSPRAAVIATGALITGLTLLGNVKVTWSFSAFTVLGYYALTNLAALKLPHSERRYPRFVPVLGLLSCLGLAFWVEPAIWLSGLGLIGAGFVWRLLLQRVSS